MKWIITFYKVNLIKNNFLILQYQLVHVKIRQTAALFASLKKKLIKSLMPATLLHIQQI